MNPEEIVKFFSEHIANWSRITLYTLLNPVSHFKPVLVYGSFDKSDRNKKQQKDFWLSPQAMIFCVISIVLGITINNLISSEVEAPELFTQVVVIFVYWVFYGSILHGLCIALRGKGAYADTMCISIQVLSAVYVASSFIALILSVLLSALKIEEESLLSELLSDPAMLFFVVDGFLLFAYLPLSLKLVHQFSKLKTVILFCIFLVVVPATAIFISVPLYINTGVKMQAPG